MGRLRASTTRTLTLAGGSRLPAGRPFNFVVLQAACVLSVSVALVAQVTLLLPHGSRLDGSTQLELAGGGGGEWLPSWRESGPSLAPFECVCVG